ncbi:MAG: glycosyltransferase family 1 protein [Myxococcales bacterium]|nr:glycosyltransferase family 1 protein [Myxococcales bacterium]
MKIAVVCNDTRGGVQPYVALAAGLRRAGHDVRMVGPGDYAPMFAGAGLPAALLSGSVEDAVKRSGGAAGRGSIASTRLAVRESKRLMNQWTQETLDGCEGVDLLTGGVGGMVVGLSVAEKLGKRFVETHLQPIGAPTDAYPGVLLPGVPRWLGAWGRRLSHRLTELALWMPFRPAMASARAQVLGLTGRPTAADGQPVLYGFSRHVVPLPELGDRVRHATGYWVLPAEAWSPPPGLEDFVARGPVVSIGFGSMASDDPGATTALVLGAVRSAGLRAVLVTAWGGLQALADDDVFVADSLPYDWLFPRVAAVVHHGGAGTTGLALRAGVPSLVVPFTMDQPFWGSRVAALGAGPTPIAHRRLTQASLAAALRQMVSDEPMRARAAQLGALIRAEDGVAVAVEHFDRLG